MCGKKKLGSYIFTSIFKKRKEKKVAFPHYAKVITFSESYLSLYCPFRGFSRVFLMFHIFNIELYVYCCKYYKAKFFPFLHVHGSYLLSQFLKYKCCKKRSKRKEKKRKKNYFYCFWILFFIKFVQLSYIFFITVFLKANNCLFRQVI